MARAHCLSAGLRYLKLTRLPRHDRGPVPGGNRSAASCLCTVLRRALYHYATRSPNMRPPRYDQYTANTLHQLRHHQGPRQHQDISEAPGHHEDTTEAPSQSTTPCRHLADATERLKTSLRHHQYITKIPLRRQDCQEACQF